MHNGNGGFGGCNGRIGVYYSFKNYNKGGFIF